MYRSSSKLELAETSRPALQLSQSAVELVPALSEPDCRARLHMPVSSVRMSGAVPLLPLRDLMAWVGTSLP